MKVYTKKGDLGRTSLFGGKKLPKSHMRIHAYGTVDELNSWLGLLRDQWADPNVQSQLYKIQNQLFDIGSSLASDPEKQPLPSGISDSDVGQLENWIDEFSDELPPLKNFILPGGHPWISQSHIARAVARRGERYIVDLSLHESVDTMVVKFMNRLSDYLFILCRLYAVRNDIEEVIWKSGNK